MNLFSSVKHVITDILTALQNTDALPKDLDLSRITVEPPRDPSHGDMATNAAMVLSKPAGLAPRALAELLVEHLAATAMVESAEIAGPGFINLRLKPSVWLGSVRDILLAGTAYGNSTMGAKEQVNVEFVSANPTGPMHVGHGRGAVFGDVLARLLFKAGFDVTREYYVNDAGAQVDHLARSLYQRYRVAAGVLTEDGFREMIERREIEYGGDYLVPAAQALFEKDGPRWLDAPESEWLPEIRAFGIAAMMELIRDDLQALGVTFDVFTSEKKLVEDGRVGQLLDDLEKRGLIYTGVLEPPKGKKPDDWEPRPQTLFKTTLYGDDIDRALKKSDGSWTYFASDIAYHADKIDRGFLNLINVLGADHGGYVKRLNAAVKAVSDNRATLDVKLIQLVSLTDDGKPLRMSKRAGTFITLREVIDEVGRDVVRFIMLTRKNDATLDFDFARVQEKTRDNPVFYVQYAHARACSVLRHAAELFPDADLSAEGLARQADVALLDAPEELALVRLLASWPRLVESAAVAHEPHRIAFYLGDLAAAFHGLWNRGNDNAELRFLVPDNVSVSLARLALVSAVATVVASGLEVFGVHPREELR
ncbi:arginine--tRNA ligase [Phaeovibrio sulfidiphilus]|uniref:Arginine--tRNA ligase n=1 Tax=Phaeovibrio sulfidiphilus TaxID=1220600 RepID=A0A8J7CD94_9PROT|nr:arginine--tRNA ligase [Phaeovibrio sulfidiphilus]MBE1237593.1 arginine--tRNA ligase [Phaeovibrio sulfidiphilus]